jgi:hypothetical protein
MGNARRIIHSARRTPARVYPPNRIPEVNEIMMHAAMHRVCHEHCWQDTVDHCRLGMEMP